MPREILINVTPRETRAALMHEGVLQEFQLERSDRRSIVGNLYLGTVTRVLPGMQAAFVEVGLARTAFLHASDIAAGRDEDGESSDIRSLLSAGDRILVQVLKEPLGTKGARLTTDVALPSRLLVYMPSGDNVGISNRIDDEAERERLRTAVEALRAEVAGGEGGLIVRTVAEGAGGAELRDDLEYLMRLWEVIRARAGEVEPGEVVHEDLPLAARVLRDQLAPDVQRVVVDDDAALGIMQRFMTDFAPDHEVALERWTGDRPLFDVHGVEEEVARALQRDVPLKSGGYLIIDQTEALTTIDVNTGGYVGHRNLEETIFKTNLEAASAIARQLRLRNLGGIIIIDFIDMDDEDHRSKVIETLRSRLAGDRARTHVSQVSSLGLVEMTRKRTTESLEHQLCEPCPTCDGRRTIRSAETICYEIYREVVREAGQFDCEGFLVIAAEPVVDLMLDEASTVLAELEDAVALPVRLQAETGYAQEQFDVVLL